MSPSSCQAVIQALTELIEQSIAEPNARMQARAKLDRLQALTQPDRMEERGHAASVDAAALDRWTSRARPTFLYIMYAMILWALPMGIIAAVSPRMAQAIATGINGYLAGLPEPLYALFGTGYLGYATLRQWGKAKGTER
jgi:hypothetical protein